MSASGPKIRVLIVDDHEMVRAGLRVFLEREEGIAVAGEASTAAEAVAQAARLLPEVVLMDLRLPGGSGIEACREILSAQAGTRVLLLTSFADEEAAMAAILAGASGYLLKDIGHDLLLRAIADAAAGRSVLDWEAAQRARERMKARGGTEIWPVRKTLSSQQRRILELVVRGKTNREIAAALGLSEKTVKNYLSNAFEKLGVARRAQAAALFTRQQ